MFEGDVSSEEAKLKRKKEREIMEILRNIKKKKPKESSFGGNSLNSPVIIPKPKRTV